jgi:hypothetical protein
MRRRPVARCLPFLFAAAASLTVAGSAAALITAPPGIAGERPADAPVATDVQANSQPEAVLATAEAVAAPVPPAPTTTSTTPPAPAPAPAPPAPAPAPVAPAPVVAPAPPAPAPAPAPLPSPSDRFRAAYEAAVPAAWRAAITVSLEPIAGTTSWGWPSGRIQISERHSATEEALRVTIAHEFGHLIAYRYGTQSPSGAPPAGWPAYSSQPLEAWADCVSRAMTGIDDASHGLPSCSGASLSWTATWLAQGPGAHPRTG